MNIKDALDKLFSLHNFGVKLGLENIKRFLEYLGNPQEKLKNIHIAGSNGKGSTASYISSILQEHNYKVGLYTSPHFVRFNERIKINNEEINDTYVSQFISDYYQFILKNKITFFEVTTAMAFCYFKENNVDYAVIETGLGGRLDATNVIKPLCSVITSICLEHTKILGETIEKIAGEKAGIIKEDSKVVIGLLPKEAKAVIKDKCELINTKLFKVDNFIEKENDAINVTVNRNNLNINELPLKGDYQKINAAIAALTVMKILNAFNKQIFQRGLKNVVLNTSLSGRYDFFNKKPDIIFDSAHNPDGIFNFLSEFKKHSNGYKNKYLIFSALNDKAYKIMLRDLREEFEDIYLTQINYERAAKIDDLKKACKILSFNVHTINDCKTYINKIKNGNKNNCLVVIGSMYLLGQIKFELEN